MSMQNMRFADAYAAVAEDKRKGIAADIDILVAAGTEEVTDIAASWACLQAQKLIAYALGLEVHEVKVFVPTQGERDKVKLSVKGSTRVDAVPGKGEDGWSVATIYKES